MDRMIQSLESRVLLSSVATFFADGTQLATDVGAARADVVHYANVLGGDVRSIAVDLRQVPASAQKQSLVKTLRSDSIKSETLIRDDVRSLATAATVNGRKTINDAILVFRHPTNLAYIARLAADIAAVGSGLTAPISKLQGDASAAYSTLGTDLNNIASANPTDAKLQTDVQQITTQSQSAIATLTSDGQTLEADLKSLGITLGG